MSDTFEQFRVGDKVTVLDPKIDNGVVTRVGRKYVAVAPENPPVRGQFLCLVGTRVGRADSSPGKWLPR
jgi:hypothetical protein